MREHNRPAQADNHQRLAVEHGLTGLCFVDHDASCAYPAAWAQWHTPHRATRELSPELAQAVRPCGVSPGTARAPSLPGWTASDT